MLIGLSGFGNIPSAHTNKKSAGRRAPGGFWKNGSRSRSEDGTFLLLFLALAAFLAFAAVFALAAFLVLVLALFGENENGAFLLLFFLLLLALAAFLALATVLALAAFLFFGGNSATKWGGVGGDGTGGEDSGDGGSDE